MGGVPKEKLEIVVAIHGEATYTITDSKTYEKRLQVYQQTVKRIKLAQAGVKFVVWQGLIARHVERPTIIPKEIKSLPVYLTTVTTQLKGLPT